MLRQVSTQGLCQDKYDSVGSDGYTLNPGRDRLQAQHLPSTYLVIDATGQGLGFKDSGYRV